MCSGAVCTQAHVAALASTLKRATHCRHSSQPWLSCCMGAHKLNGSARGAPKLRSNRSDQRPPKAPPPTTAAAVACMPSPPLLPLQPPRLTLLLLLQPPRLTLLLLLQPPRLTLLLLPLLQSLPHPATAAASLPCPTPAAAAALPGSSAVGAARPTRPAGWQTRAARACPRCCRPPSIPPPRLPPIPAPCWRCCAGPEAAWPLCARAHAQARCLPCRCRLSSRGWRVLCWCAGWCASCHSRRRRRRSCWAACARSRPYAGTPGLPAGLQGRRPALLPAAGRGSAGEKMRTRVCACVPSVRTPVHV